MAGFHIWLLLLSAYFQRTAKTRVLFRITKQITGGYYGNEKR